MFLDNGIFVLIKYFLIFFFCLFRVFAVCFTNNARSERMGSGSLLWNLTKKYLTVGVIGLTITDRYASIVPVRGGSMSPTFNPRTNTVLGSLGNAFLFFYFLEV